MTIKTMTAIRKKQARFWKN